MTKFWTVVAVVILVGIGALAFLGNSTESINFTDLETECRYDRESQTTVQLNQDDSLSFSGYFPAESPESEVDYRYSRNSDSVTLNVYTDRQPRPSSFVGTCLASAVYKGTTQPLEEGRYLVTVMHEGEVEEEKVIRIE